ncbi:MAG: tRNA (adenosine(37)-N6)-threonylcarbamoyltransferase complex ATPase subunit type 1 TsaE [Spirochaetes bacterium]|nr:MAG: tRNA (adenosine(37)-N6)-threonylcarbamoyltransferase complex ATPase subunit type 1 TsaE [Spirochaetota bacterium]
MISEDMNKQSMIVHTPEQTIEIGKEFGSKLRGGEVVLLIGVLGCGKTTFAKGVGEALGIKEDILSPSFSIMNVYEGEKLELYHFDFYRLDDETEIDDLLSEYIYLPDSVTLIEWGEKVKNLIDKYIEISFVINDGERLIEIDTRCWSETLY